MTREGADFGQAGVVTEVGNGGIWAHLDRQPEGSEFGLFHGEYAREGFRVEVCYLGQWDTALGGTCYPTREAAEDFAQLLIDDGIVDASRVRVMVGGS